MDAGTGTLGEALTGAAEIGIVLDLAAAVEDAVGVQQRYEPDDGGGAAYRDQLTELVRVRSLV